MKVLLIGLGSIAHKHLDALKKIKPECEIWALRSAKSANEVEGVCNIYKWDEIPSQIDFVMICNPTSEHFKTISRSLSLQVPLFIEKPPLMSLDGAEYLIKQVKESGVRTYTAFNFRFHPVIQWLKENLKGKRVLEVQTYCGSYLPDWRPGRDYRQVYSSKKEQGGGVHLDLIHELDYLFWMFGAPDRLQTDRDHVSDLELNSVDIAHYWMKYKAFNISVILNYYRRDPKRAIEIVMDNDTWTADLLEGSVVNKKKETIFKDSSPVSCTYKSQIEYFLAGLDNEKDYMNNLFESINTLKYCLR
jgi:predicted dehydrogenase